MAGVEVKTFEKADEILWIVNFPSVKIIIGLVENRYFINFKTGIITAIKSPKP